MTEPFQPSSTLLLETFINLDDAYRRANYAAFAKQDELPILFYGEQHQHHLAKTVYRGARERFPLILDAAGVLLAGVPIGERDFDQTKVNVMAVSRLNPDDAGQHRPTLT